MSGQEAVKKYRVSEIFYSLQGEGARAGTANVFVRFSGCNMRCDREASELSPGGFACDTEFESGRWMSAEEIVAEVLRLRPDPGVPGLWRASVILTGGEPLLQVDDTMVDRLKSADFYVALETNGSLPLPRSRPDWVCVSPKVAEHALKIEAADEVKYVRSSGQGIPKPRIKARHLVLSPAAETWGIPPENLAWCVRLVKDNPEWRLSVQQHKAWRLR